MGLAHLGLCICVYIRTGWMDERYRARFNYGVARSSPREQQSTGLLHFIVRIPFDAKNNGYQKVSVIFMGWIMGFEPTTFRATI